MEHKINKSTDTSWLPGGNQEVKTVGGVRMVMTSSGLQEESLLYCWGQGILASGCVDLGVHIQVLLG